MRADESYSLGTCSLKARIGSESNEENLGMA